MNAFLMRFYGFCEEDATEILSELTYTKSLEALAGDRGGMGGAASHRPRSCRLAARRLPFYKADTSRQMRKPPLVGMRRKFIWN